MRVVWPFAAVAVLISACSVTRVYTVKDSNSIPLGQTNASKANTDGCKVLEPAIAGLYSGVCMNGLAHGEGVANGMDKYSGEFQMGVPSGQGTYTWKDGSYYVGDWKNGRRNGFGELFLPKTSKSIETYESGPPHARGRWTQGGYVVKGLFEGNSKGSMFSLSCDSRSACKVAHDELSLKFHMTKGIPVMWRRCELGRTFDTRQMKCVGTSLKFNWVDAIAAVNQLNASKFEGYSDWRLPDSNDLKALLQGDPRTMSEVPKFLARGGSGRGWEELKACTYANEYVQDIFMRYGAAGGTFYQTQHWLADNDATWQEPISFNLEGSFGMFYHGYCNVLNIAFSKNRPQEMRVHAEIPVIVVRGGASSAWTTAQAALPKRASLLAKSEEASAQTMAYYGRKIAGVVNWIRENSAGAAAGEEVRSAENGPEFEILKDSKDQRSWTGFSREIVIKCLRGRHMDEQRTVYQNRNSGSWTAANIVGNEKSMAKAASRACDS